jgi:small GTP-binding protein
MIQKKVCLLGAFAVGKTSLVRRYVHSLFSEKYHTTVGVKIDKKTVRVRDEDVSLILWDLHGEDDFQSVRSSYLRGASGILLVVDGTRGATLHTAGLLHERVEGELGPLPFVLLLNKADAREQWDLDEGRVAELKGRGWAVLESSAKTGESVEDAFLLLATRMLES